MAAIAAGDRHSLAVTAQGALWSWGSGWYGRLGHDDEEHQLVPRRVEAFSGRRIRVVAAGSCHSLAVEDEGALWSWGVGKCGVLGHGDQRSLLRPTRIEALAGERVRAVAAGREHNLALTSDGDVWSWGDGLHGRLGHGDQQASLLPKQIVALAGACATAVAVGEGHSLCEAAGALWTWGDGSHGKLGHDGDSHELLPKRIEASEGHLQRNALSSSLPAVAASSSDRRLVTKSTLKWIPRLRQRLKLCF